ncbi:MAG TPA: flagellar hook-length control protein FliK [Phycisphaerales bacterium]|nr:flagellar hook-length control protein FliK [Phycisphaerales bacterium]
MRTSASETNNMAAGVAQFPTGSAETTRNGEETGQNFDAQVAMLLRAVAPKSEQVEKQAELTPVGKPKARKRDRDVGADANPLGMQWGTMVADQAKVDVAERNAKELRTRGERTEPERAGPQETANSGRERVSKESGDSTQSSMVAGATRAESAGKSGDAAQATPVAAMARQSAAVAATSQSQQRSEGAKAGNGAAVGGVTATGRNGNVETRVGVQAQAAPAQVTERGHQQTHVVGVGGAKANRGDAFKQLLQAAQPTKRAVEQQQVTQVALKALGMALKEGGGEVVMKLAPEALGQVKVQLQVRDAAVDAVFTTSTASARQLLEARTDSLREALEARGLRVDSIVVDGPSKDAQPITQQLPAKAQDAHTPTSSQGGALGGATDGGMNNGLGGSGGEQQQHAAQDAQRGQAEAADVALWDFPPATSVTAAGLEWVA